MFASPKVFECDRNHLLVVKEEEDGLVGPDFGGGYEEQLKERIARKQ